MVAEYESFKSKLIWKSYGNPMLSNAEIIKMENRAFNAKRNKFRSRVWSMQGRPVANMRLNALPNYSSTIFLI